MAELPWLLLAFGIVLGAVITAPVWLSVTEDGKGILTRQWWGAWFRRAALEGRDG